MVERIERTPEEIEAALIDIRPQIRAVTLRRVGNQPWLIEDAEQEATIAAWTRLAEGYPASIAIFKAAQRVTDIARGSRPVGSQTYSGHVDTYRRSVPLVRRDTVGEEYEYEPADHGTLREVERLENRQVLDDAMEVLSERDRAILWAFYGDGYQATELAEQLGLQISAVRTLMRRAKRRVAEKIAS